MVVPAHCAFKSLEKGAHVILLAPITAPLHIGDGIVLEGEILSDDHGPDHIAWRWPPNRPKIYTDFASEDITCIVPRTPVVVGNLFVAEIAGHVCRIRWFAQPVSVCEAFKAYMKYIFSEGCLSLRLLDRDVLEDVYAAVVYPGQ